MKARFLLLIVTTCFILTACGSEKKVDDSKPAPKPEFKMIPSQKSGQ